MGKRIAVTDVPLEEEDHVDGVVAKTRTVDSSAESRQSASFEFED